MANDDANVTQSSWVGALPDGRFFAIWCGQIIYDGKGLVKQFETEAQARSFLKRCDVAGKIVD